MDLMGYENFPPQSSGDLMDQKNFGSSQDYVTRIKAASATCASAACLTGSQGAKEPGGFVSHIHGVPHMNPSFLGVISPIFLGLKTFIFP